uniref:Uncharacterized protein n=2 Tax=Nymphaea colorata TaxID=210225 RepID=A0A5K1DL05_9MAGN
MKDNRGILEEIFSKEELHIHKEGNTTGEFHILKVDITTLDNLIKERPQMSQMKDVIYHLYPQR